MHISDKDKEEVLNAMVEFVKKSKKLKGLNLDGFNKAGIIVMSEAIAKS